MIAFCAKQVNVQKQNMFSQVVRILTFKIDGNNISGNFSQERNTVYRFRVQKK